MSAQPSIDDYAIIGDCRSAALVSSAGSIDWLCWPRFDSPSIFCSLLDPERGGFFSLRPRAPATTTRSYVGDSAVLCTRFHTGEGDFELVDLMPIADERAARQGLMPEHEIVRVLRCRRGSGEIEARFQPRTGFAQWNDRLRDRGTLGLRVETRQGLLTLRSDLPMTLDAERRGAVARAHLRAGESVHVSLTWTADAPAVLPPLGDWTEQVIDRSLRLWKAWSERTRYDGPHREAVMRSAITVRLLSFAPSGAVIAAPTTSLPETRGGGNNWDYRYCWLRDAAFTVRGMLELGHPEEAVAFTQWLLHATRLTHPRLRVLYDVFGRTPSKEREIPKLSGYRGEAPVRVGNGADEQIQLDTYGEVIDAVWRVTRAGTPLDREAGHAIESLGRYVCRHWQETDAGIWEPRGERLRHSHSLLLCWTAMDRLIDLQDHGDLRARYRDRFVEARAQMRRELETRGFSEKLRSYTSTLDGNTLDASALLFSWYGFEPPDSERMRQTCDAVVGALSPRAGLVFRNREAGDDGAFGICCFWHAEHLARGGGTLEQARAAFEATLAFANDVGLFAEEIDPSNGEAIGNVPQAFTHVGLINAALSIAERERSDASPLTPSREALSC